MTRPAARAGELLRRLRELGAQAVSCPTIRIVDPAESRPLRRAVRKLEEFDWVVLTSVEGVERLFAEMRNVGREDKFPEHVRTAAIGPATAAALERYGASPSVVPDRYVAEAIAEALIKSSDIRGARILLPRAAGARRALPDQLIAAGAEVEEVTAYKAEPDLRGIVSLRALIERGDIDMITFTSASTVQGLARVCGPDLGAARVVAIGPITAAAARAVGVRVDAEAGEYSVSGLVLAICDYYSERRSGVDV